MIIPVIVMEDTYPKLVDLVGLNGKVNEESRF
jgi:hypothetical protein